MLTAWDEHRSFLSHVPGPLRHIKDGWREYLRFGGSTGTLLHEYGYPHDLGDDWRWDTLRKYRIQPWRVSWLLYGALVNQHRFLRLLQFLGLGWTKDNRSDLWRLRGDCRYLEKRFALLHILRRSFRIFVKLSHDSIHVDWRHRSVQVLANVRRQAYHLPERDKCAILGVIQ